MPGSRALLGIGLSTSFRLPVKDDGFCLLRTVNGGQGPIKALKAPAGGVSAKTYNDHPKPVLSGKIIDKRTESLQDVTARMPICSARMTIFTARMSICTARMSIRTARMTKSSLRMIKSSPRMDIVTAPMAKSSQRTTVWSPPESVREPPKTASSRLKPMFFL